MNMKENKISLLAKIALLTATLIWGSSFIMVKDVVNTVPPNLLLSIRFAVACLVLCLIFWKRLKNLNREYFIQGAVIGALLFLAYCSQTIGITDTTPGKNAFLTAVYCVIVPFLFWAVSKRKPDIFNIIAAVVCIIGIGLVSLDSDFFIRLGDLLTLLGGFFFAAHIVAVSKFGSDKDPVLITILQFGYSAVYAAAASLIFERDAVNIVWSGQLVLSIAYLALACTAVGLFLQIFGQKYTSPSSAAIILSLESVFGVAFSIALYGERLTGRIAVGFVLIFIAVIISETKLSFIIKRKSEKTERIDT